MRKIFFIVAAILLSGAAAIIYWKYFYVFGEGVKSGHLNYAVKKGNLFKTYGKVLSVMGRVKETTVPGVACSPIHIDPPCASIRPLQIASPKPDP